MSTRVLTPRGTSPVGQTIKVGLGVLAVSDEKGKGLTALGLGSCIGVAAYDPVARVAGMVHVMLPDSAIATVPGPAGKYADTAIPALVEAMRRAGAEPTRLVVKIAGGAQMFASGGGNLNIGARNAIAVRAALTRAGLRVKAADTGGTFGRTLEMWVDDGRVTVRAVGREPAAL
ncbi:MAG: chemotaxis protein CheD [Actinomycetota bacterium]